MAEVIEKEKISQKVKEIIAEQFGIEPETLTEETILENDLNADSLDAVEMVMELEDEEKGFGITISNEEAEKLTTVGEVIKCVEDKVAEKKKREANQIAQRM